MLHKIKEVNTNMPTIVSIIFPSLLGCFIFDIDTVMLTKIRGMIATNSRFKKTSPKGLSIAAFSPKTIPTIAPTIIAANKIIVDL